MAVLLDLSPPLEAPPLPDLSAERALLGSLARTAEREDVRAQALVELMALEGACGDELAFERLRHELAALPLPAAVATLFRARVAWGLARFGRSAAARRWERGAARDADADQVRAWLLEFDRRAGPADR
ncbi:MAG TPA: hypothetical protein VFI13_00970 [Gemmatimonadales bacterium]|nr:hypothetical protein [Gemmatimonadales bacterium]